MNLKISWQIFLEYANRSEEMVYEFEGNINLNPEYLEEGISRRKREFKEVKKTNKRTQRMEGKTSSIIFFSYKKVFRKE